MSLSQCNYQSATLSSFGAQVNSTRRSDPRFGFGTSGHNPKVYISARHNADLFGTNSPGPATYTRESSWRQLGKMVPSTQKSPPAFGFGSAGRFSTGSASKQPGPGRYDASDIWNGQLGFNTISRHRSANKTRIGTEPRFAIGVGEFMVDSLLLCAGVCAGVSEAPIHNYSQHPVSEGSASVLIPLQSTFSTRR